MAIFDYHGRPDFHKYILKCMCENEHFLLGASFQMNEEGQIPEESKIRKEIGIRIQSMINMAVDIAIAKIMHQAKHNNPVFSSFSDVIVDILHPVYRVRKYSSNTDNNNENVAPVASVLDVNGLKHQFKDVFITLESGDDVGPNKSLVTRRERLLSHLNDKSEFWPMLVKQVNWYIGEIYKRCERQANVFDSNSRSRGFSQNPDTSSGINNGGFSGENAIENKHIISLLMVKNTLQTIVYPLFEIDYSNDKITKFLFHNKSEYKSIRDLCERLLQLEKSYKEDIDICIALIYKSLQDICSQNNSCSSSENQLKKLYMTPINSKYCDSSTRTCLIDFMKYFQVSSLRFVNFLMRISRFFVFYTVGNKYKGSEFDVFSNNKLPYELAKNVQMYFSDPYYSYMHLITTVCSAEWSTDWEHLLFNRKKNVNENKVFNFLPLLLLQPFFHLRDIADLLSKFNHLYKNPHLKNCLVGNVKPMIRLIERNFKQIQWRLLGDDSIKPYLYRIDRKGVDMTSSHCSFCQTEFLPPINSYIKIDDDTLHSDSKTHLKQFPKWIPKYCIMQTLVKTIVNHKIESKIMFLTDTGVWILKKESQNGGKKIVDHTVNKGFLGGISGGFSGFHFGSTTSIATSSNNASDGFSFNSDDFFHRWEYYMPLEILAKQNCTLKKSDNKKVTMDYAVTQDTVKKMIDAKKKEDANSFRLNSEDKPDLTVYEKYLRKVEIELPSKHMCKFFLGQVLRLECCDVIRMDLKIEKLKKGPSLRAHLKNDTEDNKDGYQSMDYIENEPTAMTDNYIGISDYQTFPLKSDSESFDWTPISTRNFGGESTETKPCEQIVFRDLIGSVTSKTIDEQERKHLTSMILYTWPALNPKSGKDGGYHDIIDTILLTLAQCCTRLQEHRTWSLTILIIWLEKNGYLDIVTVPHLVRLKTELSGLDIKSSGLEDVIKSPYWEFYKLLDMIENFIKDKNEKTNNAHDDFIQLEPENQENDCTFLTPKISMTPKTPMTSTPNSNRTTNLSTSTSKFPFEFNFEQKKHPLLFIEDAHKFALALTVHQQELLKNQIILTDLLLKTSQLVPSKNLAMKFSENLTYWLQSQLLSLKNFKERVKALDNAINILFELKALRNYMGLLDFKLGLFKYCSQLKLTFTEVFNSRSDSEKEFLSTLDCSKTAIDTMKLFKNEYQKMENLEDLKKGINVVEHGDNLKKAVKDCAFIPMPYDIIPLIIKAQDWKPEQRQEIDGKFSMVKLPMSNDGTKFGNLKKSFYMYQIISPIVACYQQAYVADLDVDRFKFENSNAKFYQDIFKTIEITEEFEFQDNFKMIMDYVKNELGEKQGALKPNKFDALYGEMVGVLANKLMPTNNSAPPPLPRRILTKTSSDLSDPTAPKRPPKRGQNNNLVQNTLAQRPQVAITRPRPPARQVQQHPMIPNTTLPQNTNTAIVNTVPRNQVSLPLVPSRNTSRSSILTANTQSRAAPPPPPPRNINSSNINTQTSEEIQEITALHPDYMQLPDPNPEYRAFS